MSELLREGNAWGVVLLALLEGRLEDAHKRRTNNLRMVSFAT